MRTNRWEAMLLSNVEIFFTVPRRQMNQSCAVFSHVISVDDFTGLWLVKRIVISALKQIVASEWSVRCGYVQVFVQLFNRVGCDYELLWIVKNKSVSLNTCIY